MDLLFCSHRPVVRHTVTPLLSLVSLWDAGAPNRGACASQRRDSHVLATTAGVAGHGGCRVRALHGGSDSGRFAGCVDVWPGSMLMWPRLGLAPMPSQASTIELPTLAPVHAMQAPSSPCLSFLPPSLLPSLLPLVPSLPSRSWGDAEVARRGNSARVVVVAPEQSRSVRLVPVRDMTLPQATQVFSYTRTLNNAHVLVLCQQFWEACASVGNDRLFRKDVHR